MTGMDASKNQWRIRGRSDALRCRAQPRCGWRLSRVVQLGAAVCGVVGAGDPLKRLALVIEFELFRTEPEAVLARSDRARGGRPPYHGC